MAVLSQLRHPNIVSLLAACTEPPAICIIEELAEGGSLHDRLHGRRSARSAGGSGGGGRAGGRRRRQPLPYKQVGRDWAWRQQRCGRHCVG